MPKRLMQQLIFGGHISSNPQSVEEDFEQLDEKRGAGRESAYVTVLEGELCKSSLSRNIDMNWMLWKRNYQNSYRPRTWTFIKPGG